MTAIDYLFKKLCSEKLSWIRDSHGKLFIDLTTSDFLQKAKEMEKEQIFDARKDVIKSINKGEVINHLEYYNKI
jgi:hypothetical protein